MEDATDVIGRALMATTSARSARLRRALHRGSPLGPVHNPKLDDIGVIDFSMGRAVVRSVLEESFGRASPRVLRRDGPWGRTAGVGSEGSPDALWAMDVVNQPHGAVRDLGPSEHHGEEVRRFTAGFAQPALRLTRVMKLASASRRRADVSTEAPLRLELWVDSQDRIRVVSVEMRRPPPLPWWTPSALKRIIESVAGNGEDVIWDTIEIWDYGCPPENPTP